MKITDYQHFQIQNRIYDLEAKILREKMEMQNYMLLEGENMMFHIRNYCYRNRSCRHWQMSEIDPPQPNTWYAIGVYSDDYDYKKHGLLMLELYGIGKYFFVDFARRDEKEKRQRLMAGLKTTAG